MDLFSAVETCRVASLKGHYIQHEKNQWHNCRCFRLYYMLAWILLPEEFGVTFEFIPGKKYVEVLTNDHSHLDIDNMKI
jgi:hypothetical protein